MSQQQQMSVGDPVSFADEMRKLINQKESSDLRFIIGPSRKAVYAHRCILAARCDVFRAMFADQTKRHKDSDVPFVLSEMSLDVFNPLLEYIYTNTVTLDTNVAVDLLGSAIDYGLDGLRKLCVSYLIDTLSDTSACDTIQAAVCHNQDELMTQTLEYIEDHTKEVFQSKSFLRMSDTALAAVLQSDNLTVAESDVLSAVQHWAKTRASELGKPAGTVAKKVVPHVRLALLTPQDLKQVETDNRKDKLIPMELLAGAWRHHALKEDDPNDPQTRPRRGSSQSQAADTSRSQSRQSGRSSPDTQTDAAK